MTPLDIIGQVPNNKISNYAKIFYSSANEFQESLVTFQIRKRENMLLYRNSQPIFILIFDSKVIV